VAAIPMVVKKKVLGTAISLMEIISSLAECVVPLITGYLVESAETVEIGFKHSSFFFFIIGLLGVLTSMLLFFIDRKIKKKLDRGDSKFIVSQKDLD
jgi:sugar phosphate permease